ncbi:MAG: hypothetical protein WD066_10065 [Planctomycetaceae bacterium]
MVHDDLLAQAELLATIDRRRPKQVNLRRAISSAYYGLFHYLVDQSCRMQMGAHRAQAAYRHAIARGFTHATMKQACASFGGGTLKASVSQGLPRNASGRYSVPIPVREIAGTFAELQQKRHAADYDWSERFGRSDVLTLIQQAKQDIAQFDSFRQSNDRKFFLACLWAWKELANR